MKRLTQIMFTASSGSSALRAEVRPVADGHRVDYAWDRARAAVRSRVT